MIIPERAGRVDCTNREVAAALRLSPHTVQDHLKGVFAKLDVGSRRS